MAVYGNITEAIGSEPARNLIQKAIFLFSIGSNDIVEYYQFNSSIKPDLFLTILVSQYEIYLRVSQYSVLNLNVCCKISLFIIKFTQLGLQYFFTESHGPWSHKTGNNKCISNWVRTSSPITKHHRWMPRHYEQLCPNILLVDPERASSTGPGVPWNDVLPW